MSTEDFEIKEYDLDEDFNIVGNDEIPNKPLKRLNIEHKTVKGDEEEEENSSSDQDEKDKKFYETMLKALNALRIDKNTKEPNIAEKRMLAAVYDDTAVSVNAPADGKYSVNVPVDEEYSADDEQEFGLTEDPYGDDYSLAALIEMEQDGMVLSKKQAARKQMLMDKKNAEF